MIEQGEMDFTGAGLRDAGCSLVLSHNEDYKAAFASCAARLLAEDGEVTSEKVVVIVGMPSGSPNAVGAAMRSFAVANSLKVSGYRKSSAVSRHAGIIAVWKRSV